MESRDQRASRSLACNSRWTQTEDAFEHVFIGDAPYLNNLANLTDEEGKYLYPDLRLALGLDQPQTALPHERGGACGEHITCGEGNHPTN
jgi:hypothetical protein